MKFQVKLDGEPLELTGNFRTLEDIFLSLNNILIEKERMITDVYLNGSPYTERWYRESRDIPIEEVESLEIITKTPKELAKLAMEGSVDALSMMKDALMNIAELYRIGDEMEANEQFANCLEAMRAFISVAEGSRRILSMDNGSDPIHGEGYSEFMEKLSSILSDIEGGQEEEDWILIADIIEYELIPHLESWKDVVATFNS